ncbi:MAG: histidinol dehydrogenase, partial [Pseudomonadota bacterium]
MPDFQINRLNTLGSDFDARLDALLRWDETEDLAIHQRVMEIISAVRTHGDAALLEYTQTFDRRQVASAKDLELSHETLKTAWENLPPNWADALNVAAERIKAYAEHQKLESWRHVEADGTMLGQQVTPLDRAGLYVPGGKAAYPSSVLMNAIPAKVAGVRELVMVVPAPNGELNTLVLAAAHLARVDRVFTVGGAQAVAALAYGTESIPRVEKIVGPGNIYVATAKKLVFGQVGIDMIAGPSEILIICDGKTDSDWIAADLLSQAEHDEDAQAILLSPDTDFLEAVRASIATLLPQMERAKVIRKSLGSRGALIR